MGFQESEKIESLQSENRVSTGPYRVPNIFLKKTLNKRNRNSGRDDVLLKCNIGHSRDLLALLQERFMSKWWQIDPK